MVRRSRPLPQVADRSCPQRRLHRRKNPHQAVQNSRRATFPLTKALVNFLTGSGCGVKSWRGLFVVCAGKQTKSNEEEGADQCSPARTWFALMSRACESSIGAAQDKRVVTLLTKTKFAEQFERVSFSQEEQWCGVHSGTGRGEALVFAAGLLRQQVRRACRSRAPSRAENAAAPRIRG
jgi:hypothetical protein